MANNKSNRKIAAQKTVLVKKKKTRYTKAVRFVSVFLCVLLVGFIGAGAWLYLHYKSLVPPPTPPPGPQPTGQEIVVEPQGVINVLLLGVDSNAEREAVHFGWRSDVIIVCSIDTTNNKMSMITIPRDTYTYVNQLDEQTGKITDRKKDKITHAYMFGGGPDKYGAKNAVDAVQEYLSCGGKYDFTIDHYVSIDMDGFPKLAGAVGGVDVVLPHSYPGGYKEGDIYTVTQENADEFVRNRKEGGHGDDGRNERQQLFLVAFLKKVKELGAVKTATKLYGTLTQYMNTDMNLDEIVAFSSLFSRFNIDGIERYRLVGEGEKIKGIWYDIIPEEELENAVLKYLYGLEE